MAELVREIDQRRAYRALAERQVEEEVRERIMTAATYAPSCSNNQPWRFLVVQSEQARAKVAEGLARGNYWAQHAPMFVLVTTKVDLDCNRDDRREYALFDAGMATMNLQLQAVKEGLIAHPIAGFDDVQLKRSFEIPDEYILITVVVLGYPGDSSHLNEKHAQLEVADRSRAEQSSVICVDGWEFA